MKLRREMAEVVKARASLCACWGKESRVMVGKLPRMGEGRLSSGLTDHGATLPNLDGCVKHSTSATVGPAVCGAV